MGVTNTYLYDLEEIYRVYNISLAIEFSGLKSYVMWIKVFDKKKTKKIYGALL